MRGSTFKRCPCPVRRDDRGRRLSCGKSHGSWSYVVDVPATAGEKRRQVMKGGFSTRLARRPHSLSSSAKPAALSGRRPESAGRTTHRRPTARKDSARLTPEL